jgi:hypothetical protein
MSEHDLDFGRCDRCRFFSAMAKENCFQPYPVGICHWKWRSCSPYDAVPLVARDSHCSAFEAAALPPSSRDTPTVDRGTEA